MAPPGHKLHCSVLRKAMADVSVCHRYDQSAVNILLGNRFGFNLSRYSVNTTGYAYIDRTVEKQKRERIVIVIAIVIVIVIVIAQSNCSMRNIAA